MSVLFFEAVDDDRAEDHDETPRRGRSVELELVAAV
jgi:hypothetical protein